MSNPPRIGPVRALNAAGAAGVPSYCDARPWPFRYSHPISLSTCDPARDEARADRGILADAGNPGLRPSGQPSGARSKIDIEKINGDVDP